MRRFFLIVFLVSGFAAQGCSGCDDDSGTIKPGTDSGELPDAGVDLGQDQSEQTDAEMESDMSEPDLPIDMTGPVCGDIECALGQECFSGFCVDPCPLPEDTRCGASFELCCSGEDVCLGAQCITPGDPCAATEDCELTEICEPTLGRCVPRDAVEVCEYRPPVGEFLPEVLCRWSPNPGDPNQNRVDVVATPVVVNLTDDNGDGLTNTDDIPDIVFLTYDLNGDGCCNRSSTIRVVDGECSPDGTMRTHGSINALPMDNSAGLAVADLDGDGVPEILAIGMRPENDRQPQGVIAWKRVTSDGSEWEVFWHNDQYPTWNVHTRGGATISVANLDAAGAPEVIVGNVVLNGLTGELIWDGLQSVGPGAGIGNNGFLGPSSTAGDVNLDGTLEVAAGNTLYAHDGTELWTFEFPDSNSPCGGSLPCDGFTAMANFDDDPEGEIVIVRRGEVYILNHDGTLLWSAKIPVNNCNFNESGPPTIADFDGDGRAEIGTAAADFYVVLDMDCDADPVPEGCHSRGILWAVPNQDCSSRVTASSVFDFEGDGKAEMVYADEVSMRIFDGTTGMTLFNDPTFGSHTRIEMPIVVDVNNDGNSEIVIPENRSRGGTPGIKVWGDTSDNWVRTRRIWNQHSYHVSNINEDGSVPLYETPNWSNSRLNNFRQNVQPGGIFDAPNLVLEQLVVRGTGCGESSEVVIRITVANRGALGVAAGVGVRAIATSGADQEILIDAATQTRLLPGQTEVIELTWTVPANYITNGFEIAASVDPDMMFNECHEDDNDMTINGADIQFSAPDLVIASITAAADNCNNDQIISGTVTLRNDGTEPVPANTPIEITAVWPGGSDTVSSPRLQSVLNPGEETTLDYTWTGPPSILSRTVTIRATVDPNQEVYVCDDQSFGETDIECRILN